MKKQTAKTKSCKRVTSPYLLQSRKLREIGKNKDGGLIRSEGKYLPIPFSELNIKNLCWLRVPNSLMDPTLPMGTHVLIDTSKASIMCEAIYAVDLGKGPFICRLYTGLNTDVGGGIGFKFDNERYGEVFVPVSNGMRKVKSIKRLLDDLQIIGRVVGTLERFPGGVKLAP